MRQPIAGPRNIIAAVAICEGGCALLAIGLGSLLERPPLQQFQWSPASLAWGVVACLPMLLGFVVVLRSRLRVLKDLRETVDNLVAPLFFGCSTGALLLISVLAGVGEEMLFRGVVQEAIAKRFSVHLGVLAAGILFGLVHPVTVGYGVMAGAIGVYLGWCAAASGNLVVPTIAHALYDFIVLLYLVRARNKNSGPIPKDRTAGVDQTFL